MKKTRHYIRTVFGAALCLGILSGTSKADLLGYWPMDGNLKDLSGLGNNGIIGPGSSDVSFQSDGKVDGAIQLPGITDKILFPSIDVSSEFTVAGWCKLTGAGNYDRFLVSKYNTGFFLGQNAATTEWMFIVANNFSLHGGTMVFDEWQHVAGTYGGGQARLYINGVLAAGPIPMAAPSEPDLPVYLGTAGGGDRSLRGLFDEIRIYNHALSIGEIAVLVNNRIRAHNPVPANGAIAVGTSTGINSEATVDLGWNTACDPANLDNVNPDITDHYLYLAQDEPNFVGVTPVTIDAGTPDATGAYQTTLLMDKTYYWRVDEGINNSAAGDPNTLIGPVWLFSTLKSLPEITVQPQDVLTDAGQTAEFLITTISLSPAFYTWYKSADNANNTLGDDIVKAGPTLDGNTLALNNVQPADEGYYYCKIANAAGTVQSEVAALSINRKIAHWTLNTDKYIGGQHLDEAGNYPADPNGTPIFVPGKIDQGVEIDAADGWASASTWNPSEFSGKLTVSFWLKWAGTNGTFQTFVAKRSDGAWDNANVLWQVSSGSNDKALWFQTPRTLVGVTDGLVTDQWQYVVATFDGTTGKVYINGEQRASGIWTYGDAVDAPIMLGCANPAGAAPMDGVLDDVQIYNFALDAAAVAQAYADVSGESICVYWPELDISGPDGGQDCVVNLYDFVEFAASWLESGLVHPTQP